MMVGQATKLAGLGIAIGASVAWLMAPLLDSQLYGVRPIDPATFVAVPLLLLDVAALAALAPARKAMRVDPLAALRIE